MQPHVLRRVTADQLLDNAVTAFGVFHLIFAGEVIQRRLDLYVVTRIVVVALNKEGQHFGFTQLGLSGAAGDGGSIGNGEEGDKDGAGAAKVLICCVPNDIRVTQATHHLPEIPLGTQRLV